MANYYTDYSFAFKVTDEQYQWIKDKNKQEEYPEYPEFNCELQDAGQPGQHIWFYSFGDDTAYGGLGDLGEFLSEFLEHFEDDRDITIEYANTCSKPRLESFSGGIHIVTRSDVHSWWTGKEYQTWKKRQEVDSE